MKKMFITITIICLCSCGIQKQEETVQNKIKRLTESLDYKVVLPNDWNSILDSHQLLSYSPKNLGDIFYKNIIRIYDKDLDENENYILKNLVIENINASRKNVNIDLKKSVPIISKYGETFVTRYESDWNSTHYINTSFYFIHKEKFFIFRYSSDEKFYEKYFSDVNSIFNNLEFEN